MTVDTTPVQSRTLGFRIASRNHRPTIWNESPMSTELPLSAVTLIYTDDDGTEYIQSLSDIEQAGTLIDPRTGDDLTLDRVVVDQPTPAAGSFHDPAVGGLAARVARTESPTDPPLIDWLTAHQNDERVQHAVESLLGRLRAMSGVLHHAVPARTRHDW